MKKYILLLLMLMLCFSVALAEGPFGEAVVYELGMRSSGPASVVALEEGGFLFGGRIDDPATDATVAALLCMDATGNERWRVEIEEQTRTWLMTVHQLADGSIVALQDTQRPQAEALELGPTRWNIVRVKDGELISSLPLEPGDEQNPPELFAANDGYFVFYGERRERDKHRGTFHVPALELRDYEGNVRWKRVFDENELRIFGVLPVDGGYVFYGSEEDQRNGNRDTMGLLMMLDEQGELLWRTEVPSERWMHVSNAVVAPSGNIAANTRHVLKPTKSDEFPTRFTYLYMTQEGELLLEKELEPSDPLYRVYSLLTTEQSLIALASEDEFGFMSRLVLLDEDLNALGEWPVNPRAEHTNSTRYLKRAGDSYLLMETVMGDMLNGDTVYATPIDISIAQP